MRTLIPISYLIVKKFFTSENSVNTAKSQCSEQEMKSNHYISGQMGFIIFCLFVILAETHYRSKKNEGSADNLSILKNIQNLFVSREAQMINQLVRLFNEYNGIVERQVLRKEAMLLAIQRYEESLEEKLKISQFRMSVLGIKGGESKTEVVEIEKEKRYRELQSKFSRYPTIPSAIVSEDSKEFKKYAENIKIVKSVIEERLSYHNDVEVAFEQFLEKSYQNLRENQVVVDAQFETLGLS